MTASRNSPMPALFIGHGSPMNTLETNRFTAAWRAFGRSLPKPRAVLCISAHWHIGVTAVTAMPRPRTIHDFYGFPRELSEVQYPAPGDPAFAAEVADLAKPDHVVLDNDSWGLDHGAWSVLAHLLPKADVPVVQLSLHAHREVDWHVQLGARLEPLRRKGVLILGSGNVVHNLRLINFRDPAPADWAARANTLLRARIEAGDVDALANWRALGTDVALGIPTAEHYLPLLYALGARREDDKIHIFNDEVTSSLSMLSVTVG